MVNEKSIRAAYIFLRKNNNSIPDETLYFMLQASLERLKKISRHASNEELHPARVVNYRGEEIRIFTELRGHECSWRGNYYNSLNDAQQAIINFLEYS